MSNPDIIVSTSTDFAVTRRGRPVAAARWDDVVRIRAYRRAGAAFGPLCLDIDLPANVVATIDEDSPGWDDFLSDLEAQLPDARPTESWLADLAHPNAATAKILVFDRSADAV